MHTPKREFSLVIPVWNEANSVIPLVQRIHTVCHKNNYLYHLIFVDDHSSDGTIETIQSLTPTYPIEILIKPDTIPQGKAYSLLYGFSHTSTAIVGMIDGDLQYPPESLPRMLDLLQDHGVVVAKRKTNSTSLIRKLFTHIFKTVFGQWLHGFSCDIQSGFKLFQKDILLHLDVSHVTSWTFDLLLLTTARNIGYSISEVEIEFDKRLHGNSKVNLLKTSWEIGFNALKLKLRSSAIYHIQPSNKLNMIGAGVVHHQKHLITHTTLHHSQSALQTLIPWQQIFLIFLGIGLVIGLLLNPIAMITLVIGLLSGIYFMDVIFSLYLVLKSLYKPPEITFSPQEMSSLSKSNLPLYTILCPLYKESAVLSAFINSIKKLDWPKNKLEVLLLLEEDDTETWNAVKMMHLPRYIHPILIPDSQPKTKPKACNYGLNKAHGEYLVIYDAEDRPDPDQLKKAYLGFSKLPRRVTCLQAKLNYYNQHQNLLTRLFAAEYSLWFDVILTGLQSINTAIPLGGTSNHFKTKFLKELEGWDPFNVTEDCDLGIRLFKRGYRTAIFDSYTLEEANSEPYNWLRQRSRWIKGYFQTYFVHNRHPLEFIKSHGIHAFIFQLIIGARISFMLINPLLWLVTISYFTLNRFVGSYIESVYPALIFYMAATSLVIGNFMYIYNYMIGCAKHKSWYLIRYVYLIPFYWLMASAAAGLAFFQLITKPHYWEKTVHGLHLHQQPAVKFSMNYEFLHNKIIASGSMLVIATLITNLGNFLFNIYLGRSFPLESYGEFTLFMSLLSISLIPLSALATTITQKTAYLFGKYSKSVAREYLINSLHSSIIFALVLTAGWLNLLPYIRSFFQGYSNTPYLLFTPVWILGLLLQSFSGYLQGIMSFGILGMMMITDILTKTGISLLLIKLGLQKLIVLILPISLAAQMIVSLITIMKRPSHIPKLPKFSFDLPFFISSIMMSVSSAAFLGFDIVLANHYLPKVEAALYSILSITGKISYFTSSIFLPFITPLVSKNEGAHKNSRNILITFGGITAVIAGSIYVGISSVGSYLVPLILGEKSLHIIPYIPYYLLAVTIFNISRPIIQYFQAKKQYIFVMAGMMLCGIQIVLIHFSQHNLDQFVRMMLLSSLIYMTTIIGIYIFRDYLRSSDVYHVITRFFSPHQIPAFSYTEKNQPLRILIFNWRDIKHVWAGGSEIYIHEVAKRWIRAGHQVTLFCGNDGHNQSSEVIDGISIIRRGGFYTVYIWAFLYYIFQFHHTYDVVIDTENGIPFFTPLYVRSPKFLLIYHIHQEVFRKHLPFHLSIIARFMESVMMPLIYQSQPVITISESSKQDILKINAKSSPSIEIVHPGVHSYKLFSKKTVHPSFIYIGRLKPYKNIDVIITAFKKISLLYPNARLNIAGTGESLHSLQQLTKQLDLEKTVNFLGRVSDHEKNKLLASSWVMLQPSMIEGWGITVIEANAAGTPVIASDVSGLRDSVINHKTGILVPPQNIEQFAAAMQLITEDKLLRTKLSKIAFQWSKNFTWEKSAKQLISIIKTRLIIQQTNFVDNFNVIENDINTSTQKYLPTFPIEKFNYFENEFKI